eukprot:5223321-Prorocentrum_lima.AAC.1
MSGGLTTSCGCTEARWRLRAKPHPTFDRSIQRAMSRLFPGVSSDGLDQATLECAKGGLGWHRA